MRKAALATVVDEPFLAQSSTQQAQLSKDQAANCRFTDTEAFIFLIDFFPVLIFAAHGTFTWRTGHAVSSFLLICKAHCTNRDNSEDNYYTQACLLILMSPVRNPPNKEEHKKY